VLRNLSCNERLACLKLDTLECRRIKADLILYYKIMHNLTPWPIDRYFNMSVYSRHARLTESIGDFHISAHFCRTVAYQNDFFHRCVSCWNNVLAVVINATSLKQFTNALVRVDVTNYTCNTDCNFNSLYVILCLCYGVTLAAF